MHRQKTVLGNSTLLTITVLLLLMSSRLSMPTQAQDDITVTPIATATLRPVTQAEVNEAAQNLYCPVCENLPLAVCFTDACEDWKQQVRDLLAQGYTVEQIEAYFAARFGQKTVGTPITLQAQLLTIVLPVALIALIGVVIVINLLQWRVRHQREQGLTPVSPEDEVDSSKDDEYRARLEAELSQE